MTFLYDGHIAIPLGKFDILRKTSLCPMVFSQLDTDPEDGGHRRFNNFRPLIIGMGGLRIVRPKVATFMSRRIYS